MVTIKSDPNALCALSAVDKRLTFLKEKHNNLNIEDVRRDSDVQELF